MTIINELLGRPLLKIYQDPDFFNFSLDSILLADFVSLPVRTKKICDLCTGNAPIPLYLSLRTNALIFGVEVQEAVYDLGVKSVAINNLGNQIFLSLGDLKGIASKLGKNTFDVVTCNPPFFKVGSNNLNPSDFKAIARHELLATLDDVVKEAAALLNSKGRFALVHRPQRLLEILEIFKKYHIEPKRLRFVYPKINAACNHILLEGIKDGSSGGLSVLPPLFIYDGDKWTEEVRKIYNCEEE